MPALFLKTHVSGYSRKDGTYVAPHDDRRAPAKRRESKASKTGKEKRDVTTTKEFRDWFGDSKVVDKNGKPLPVYHGSTAKFSEFDPEKRGSSTGAKSALGGFFFTDNKAAAETYASQNFQDGKKASDDIDKARAEIQALTGMSPERAAVSLFNGKLDDHPDIQKIEAAFERLGEAEDKMATLGDEYFAPDNRKAKGGRVYKVYLSIQNPLVHVQEKPDYRDALFSELVERAKKEGHDGLIIRNTLDTALTPEVEIESMDVFIAFRPEQIKSATNNSGAFNPNSADITKSVSATALFMKAPTAADASQAQLEAGNYRKKHIRFQGLEIAIENPAGSTRSGTDRTGKKWKITMACDYGYIKGSMGVDGDHVDCYVGPDEEADTAYVVHQRKVGRWDEFDEDKVMLGFPSEEAAKETYLKHYDDPRFLGPVTAMPMEEFKRKVLATKEKPKMIKAIAVFGAPVEPAAAGAQSPEKPVLCLDFDGVLHDHAGLEWTGEADIFGPPIHGAKEAVDFLRTRYTVVVHSARCCTTEGRQSIVSWLAMYGIAVDEVCEHKPAAFAYVDDLGVPFYGDWSEVIARVRDMPYAQPVVLKKALPDDGPMVGDKIEFASDRLTEKGPSSGSITDAKITEDGAYILVRHSDTEEWMSWTDLEPHARRMKNVRGWFIKAGERVALFTKAYVRPHSRRVNGKVVQVGGYENKVVAKPKDVKRATDGQNRDLFEQAPAPEKEKKLDPALDPDRIARMAEGVHRAEEREMKRRAEWEKGHTARMAEIEKVPLPTWQSVDGVDVLRIGDFPHVAVPANGKKNSATFHIIDLRDRSDIVTQLKKVEVNHWLMNAARNQS